MRGALVSRGLGVCTLCVRTCVRILTVGGWGVGGWVGCPRGGGGTLNIRLFGNFSGFLPYPGPSRPPAAGPPLPPRPRPLPHRTGHTKVCSPHHKVQPPSPTTKIGRLSKDPVHPRIEKPANQIIRLALKSNSKNIYLNNLIKNNYMKFHRIYIRAKLLLFLKLRGASICKCAAGVQEATHSPKMFCARGSCVSGAGVLHTLCAHFACGF